MGSRRIKKRPQKEKPGRVKFTPTPVDLAQQQVERFRSRVPRPLGGEGLGEEPIDAIGESPVEAEPEE